MALSIVYHLVPRCFFPCFLITGAAKLSRIDSSVSHTDGVMGKEAHVASGLSERDGHFAARSSSRSESFNTAAARWKKIVHGKIQPDSGCSPSAVCKKEGQSQSRYIFNSNIKKPKKLQANTRANQFTFCRTSPPRRPTFKCGSQAFIQGAGRKTRPCLLSEIFNRSSESVVIVGDGKSVSSHGGQNPTSLASCFAAPQSKLSPSLTVATRNPTKQQQQQQQQRKSNWTALQHAIISTACSANQAPAALAQDEQRLALAGPQSVCLSISRSHLNPYLFIMLHSSRALLHSSN